MFSARFCMRVHSMREKEQLNGRNSAITKRCTLRTIISPNDVIIIYSMCEIRSFSSSLFRQPATRYQYARKQQELFAARVSRLFIVHHQHNLNISLVCHSMRFIIERENIANANANVYNKLLDRYSLTENSFADRKILPLFPRFFAFNQMHKVYLSESECIQIN